MTKNNTPNIGSIGWKIKELRELRHLTQKELGLKCGFSESSADARIRAWENGRQIPRLNAISKLSKALDVDSSVFYADANLNAIVTAFHALFDIEEFFGLHPVMIDDKYYLAFNEEYSDPYHQFCFDLLIRKFLEAWYDKYKDSMSNAFPEDSPVLDEYDYIDNDELKNSPAASQIYSKADYRLWSYLFPNNIDIDLPNDLFELYEKRIHLIHESKKPMTTDERDKILYKKFEIEKEMDILIEKLK